MFAFSFNKQLQPCRLYQRAIGIAFSLGTGDVKLLSSLIVIFRFGICVGNEDLILSIDQCVEMTFFEGKLCRFFVVKVKNLVMN